MIKEEIRVISKVLNFIFRRSVMKVSRANITPTHAALAYDNTVAVIIRTVSTNRMFVLRAFFSIIMRDIVAGMNRASAAP
jgi:hypothetical protein